MIEQQFKSVHLIFKSHLDIGFTDLAEQVIRHYFTEFIPQAMDTAEQLRGSDTPFVWTTGSWLIYQFLEEAPEALRLRMEETIRRGEIHWHALPFTSHSEAAGPEIFSAGLDFSRELDRRFGRETVAAKMTDVPGHTLGIIPLLAQGGVKFLHIGINEASHPVDVPPLFRWRHPSGEEILVNYQSGYGDLTTFPGVEDALYFSHKHDNLGPPGVKQVQAAYADCRAKFPGARVVASSLNDFALALEPHRERLPLVEAELGDTWIHGIGTDPLKMARFRRLVRLIRLWRSQPESAPPEEELRLMERQLGLVAEHTWGMDLKTHFSDYFHYGKEEFGKLRNQERISADCQERSYDEFVKGIAGPPAEKVERTDQDPSRFEASWREQNEYISQAVDALSSPEFRKQAEAALGEVEPAWPSLEGFEPVSSDGLNSFGRWRFRFNRKTGAMEILEDTLSGRFLAGGSPGLGLFVYEVFSHREYEEFYRRYIRPEQDHRWWSLQDFTKPGLRGVEDLVYTLFIPEEARFFCRETGEILEVAVRVSLPEDAYRRYGAPEEVMLLYRFSRREGAIGLDLHWRKKDASRIPEASWLQFGFSPGKPEGWYLDKLGTRISPFQVVPFGNRALHGVGEGIGYDGEGAAREDAPPSFTLATLDAPLVSPGKPRILAFDTAQPDLRDGFAVNLHNNLWGTNFPMWYEKDGLFRFRLAVED